MRATRFSDLTSAQLVVGCILCLVGVYVTMNLPEEETKPSLETTPVNEVQKPNPIEIRTKLGRILGIEESISDSRVIFSFKGIPYAQPPIGELRLKDPVPVASWSGVRGGQTPPSCPQFDWKVAMNGTISVAGDEDCLYLNVYSPKDSDSDLPVMVWIHGGGFGLGDADMIGGTPKFLLARDVVLVSIQYRLGLLGFVSTEDSILPGNLGMKDQSLALRWVQDNIGDFGGDPNRVTIFGQSAGGASVHLHLLSPYSEGLFHGAILQSGTALNPWASRNDHKQVAEKLPELLNCSGVGEPLDSINVKSCLMDASVNDLVLASMKFSIWDRMPFVMTPRVDGDFLPDRPALLLREGRYHKVNMISGITSHEMGFSSLNLANTEKMKEFAKNFDVIAPIVCGTDTEESELGLFMAKSIFHRYLESTELSEDYADKFVQLTSDSNFNIGHDEAVLAHAKDPQEEKKVYAYEFAYNGADTLTHRMNMTYPGNYVIHGSELEYLFNNIIGLGDSDDPAMLFVSEIMVQLWTNFATLWNPTPDLSLGFKWRPVSPDAYHHLSIKPAPTMRSDYRTERREFWKNLPTTMNKHLYPEIFAEET